MTKKRATAIKTTKPAAERGPSRTPLPNPQTKREMVLTLLRRPAGATIADIASVTQWQLHSVRGFLSGTIKAKLGLRLTTERVDGVTRYRLAKGS